jgi:hypothetical protein
LLKDLECGLIHEVDLLDHILVNKVGFKPLLDVPGDQLFKEFDLASGHLLGLQVIVQFLDLRPATFDDGPLY